MFITPGSRQGRHRRAFKDEQGSIYPSNVRITASVANNLLYVSVAPNRPGRAMWFPFRHPTASDGSTLWVQSRDPLLINTVATGATLASANSTAFRFWVCVFYATNGALYPALINCSTSTQVYPLNTWRAQTTTAISGSATAAGTFYTPVVIGTASPFCIAGFVEYNSTGLGTAGTYATAPNFVQTFGPGCRMPGDIVQSVYATTTNSATTTSTSPVATNLTTSFTLNSAANKVIASWGGSLSDNNSSFAVYASLYRDTTQIGPIASAYSVTVLTNVGCGGSAFDFPNSTSALTYAVKIFTDNSAATARFPYNFNSGAAEIIQEVMG